MCVIFVCEKRHPTDNEIERAGQVNPDGIGIAWAEIDNFDSKKNRVAFRKGMNTAGFLKFFAHKKDSLVFPYVIHFRLASLGGKGMELTHPFPMTRNVPLSLKGSMKAPMLFHNGHISDWEKYVAVLEANRGGKPDGTWSDSRGLAWAGFFTQSRILSRVKGWNKFAVSRPDGRVDMLGDGWVNNSGLHSSNNYWQVRKPAVHGIGGIGGIRAGYRGRAWNDIWGDSMDDRKAAGFDGRYHYNPPLNGTYKTEEVKKAEKVEEAEVKKSEASKTVEADSVDEEMIIDEVLWYLYSNREMTLDSIINRVADELEILPSDAEDAFSSFIVEYTSLPFEAQEDEEDAGNEARAEAEIFAPEHVSHT